MPTFDAFTPISLAEYENGMSKRADEQSLTLGALYTARFRLDHDKVEAAANPVRIDHVGAHKLGGSAIKLTLLTSDLRTFYEAPGRMANGLWSADTKFQFSAPIKAIVNSAYLVEYDDGISNEFFSSAERMLELSGSQRL